MGEDEIDAIGAGDQGIQFGYASNETEEYMPYAINMAHKLARQLTKIRKDGTLKYLRPDGKTQVTVEYDEAGKPSRIDAVVCSTQHLVSYPVMAFLMGRSGLNAFFYTPMFLAATCMGGTIAYFFLKALSHAGMLAKFQQSLGAKVYDRKSDKSQTIDQSSTAADSLHH